MLLEMNPINPQKRMVDQVVDLLKRGGVIAYPTDTQYGIGCDIMNKRAIEKIYLLKVLNEHRWNVKAAAEAFPGWRRTTPLSRSRYLFRLKELLEVSFLANPDSLA